MQEENEQIAAGLKQSLESTRDGLTSFLVSLRQAGLPDAVKGYRQLQMVLIQQRLWARHQSRDELAPLFDAIAQNAQELRAIFATYADIFEPLGDLPNITDAQSGTADSIKSEATQHTGDENQTKATTDVSIKPCGAKAQSVILPKTKSALVIIELLMMHGALSRKKIVQLVGRKPEQVQNDLDTLATAGAIEKNGERTVRYQLSMKFIRRFLRQSPGIAISDSGRTSVKTSAKTNRPKKRRKTTAR